jgi:hypothetical protein
MDAVNLELLNNEISARESQDALQTEKTSALEKKLTETTATLTSLQNNVNDMLSILLEKIQYTYNRPPMAVTFDDLETTTTFPITSGGLTIAHTSQPNSNGMAYVISEPEGNKYIQLSKVIYPEQTSFAQTWFDITRNALEASTTLIFQARVRFCTAQKNFEIRLYKDNNNRAYSKQINWRNGKMVYAGVTTNIFLNEWFTLRIVCTGTVGVNFKTTTYINNKEILTTSAPAKGTDMTINNITNARFIGLSAEQGNVDFDDIVFYTEDDGATVTGKTIELSEEIASVVDSTLILTKNDVTVQDGNLVIS